MIPVTKPFLPPFEEYNKYLEGIWSRNWLTNNGPLVNELELKLKEYLGIDHMLFLTNGTVALQIAIKALGLEGEIITTPFSFVATTSSILWEGCKPVFVDIDPNTLNIDPSKIEAAITTKTSAILATHVFGNPCDIMAIEKIAHKRKLKVIYDAAHCFGTKYNGRSVFEFGDISTTSFHATKLYHTVEGGAVFSRDADLIRRMSLLRNFGYNGPVEFAEVGLNAKNSEVHAAMGLVNLQYFESIRIHREALCKRYGSWLESRPDLKFQQLTPNTQFNYAYYPVIFKSEEVLIKVEEALTANWIYPRRYFYPSLNTVKLFSEDNELETSESVSVRILCLPLYHQLQMEEVDFVCRIILRTLNN